MTTMGKTEKIVIWSVVGVIASLTLIILVSFQNYSSSGKARDDRVCWSGYEQYVENLGLNAITYDEYESSYCQ